MWATIAWRRHLGAVAGNFQGKDPHLNSFDFVLKKLSVSEIWVLQLVCDFQQLRLSDIYQVMDEDEYRKTRSSICKLEKRGLIAPDLQGVWSPTWMGRGVDNWRTQVQLSEDGQAIPEPRKGENGVHPGPPCSDYRAALFWPGFCWCGRPRAFHAGEAVRAALRILRTGR